MKTCYVLAMGLFMFSTVCAAAAPALATESLYELQISLLNQQGKPQALDYYRGHAAIVAMFYGNCPNVCPLLIESVRATEKALQPQVLSGLRVLLVSIDPQRDTPQALATLARTRHIDTTRWTLASASNEDVRTLAAALGVQYRRLPNGDYNHTSMLTLLAPNGAIIQQTSVLGKADEKFVSAVTLAAGR